MHPHRSILHVDMDAFFASVEQRDHPELRGKPVLVGGDGPRGVVAAASYEARVFGIHSAMPSAIAKRLCPDAIFVSGSHSNYRKISKRVFEIFERFTPVVQPLSIDEAFLDVTGSQSLFGPPVEIARQIRALIIDELALTCSVGIATNKFLAKLASDMNKPDGMMQIEHDRVNEILDPLPASKIPGVGPASMQSLARLGVRTIGDLRKIPALTLCTKLGEQGDRLHKLANGIDERPVRQDRGAKSISHEHTFETDREHPDEVRALIARQCEDVAYRLRKNNLYARTLTLKMRFGDFQTVTRSHTLENQTNQTSIIHLAATGLFDQWARDYRPIRLIGVGVSQLCPHASPAGLFDHDADETQQQVDKVGDEIANRFGKGAVMRASSLHANPRHGAHGPGSRTPNSGDHP